MKTEYSYDPACEPLALHFLFNHPNQRPGDMIALAQAIQGAAEDFMRDVDKRSEVAA